MKGEWTIPNEPELLYLRQRVARLEAENDYLRGNKYEGYSMTNNPELLSLPIVPETLRLDKVAYASISEEKEAPGGNHVIVRGKPSRSEGIIEYAYFSDYKAFLTADILGLMSHLHDQVVHALANLLEKK